MAAPFAPLRTRDPMAAPRAPLRTRDPMAAPRAVLRATALWCVRSAPPAALGAPATLSQEREKELLLEGFELAEAALGLDDANYGCHKW
eukprot:4562191-Prymnesium_polylepis.1